MIALPEQPPLDPLAYVPPEERRRIIVRCAAADGFRFFLQTYVLIEDQQYGTIPFALWPAHARMLDALDPHQLLIVLKARQIGMSWLLGAAYPLWLAMFHPNKLAMLFSRREEDAKELIRKCRFVWARLPEWMRVPLSDDNQMALVFGRMDSRILAFPSNPEAGSSYSASYVLADEHAKQTYARQQFAAIRPTIDMGGTFVALSSANGSGTFHAQLWRSAKAGLNGFTPLFFPYDCHPRRDAQWWDDKRATFDGQVHDQSPSPAVAGFFLRAYFFSTNPIPSSM